MQHLSLISAAQSDTGIVRDHNEDAVLERPQAGLWAVADGMGGHSAGDVASALVMQHLSLLDADGSLSEVADRIDDALQNANSELRTLARQRNTQTIGSTVAVLAVRAQFALIAWAGDSRIYRWRDQRLEQLSQDHALVTELLAHGVITHDQAARHPHGNLVTRAVGAGDALHLDLEIVELRRGDVFVLCSDGLDKEADADDIAEVLKRSDVADIPTQLIELALERGGRDNVSVLAIEVCADDEGHRSLTTTSADDAGEDTLPDFSLSADGR